MGRRKAPRLDAYTFSRDQAAIHAQVGGPLDGFVGKHFATGFTAGRENLPPEKASAGSQLNRSALRKARSREGDQRVWNIFKQRVFSDANRGRLRGRRRTGLRAIDSRGAGRRDLRL